MGVEMGRVSGLFERREVAASGLEVDPAEARMEKITGISRSRTHSERRATGMCGIWRMFCLLGRGSGSEVGSSIVTGVLRIEIVLFLYKRLRESNHRRRALFAPGVPCAHRYRTCREEGRSVYRPHLAREAPFFSRKGHRREAHRDLSLSALCRSSVSWKRNVLRLCLAGGEDLSEKIERSPNRQVIRALLYWTVRKNLPSQRPPEKIELPRTILSVPMRPLMLQKG